MYVRETRLARRLYKTRLTETQAIYTVDYACWETVGD